MGQEENEKMKLENEDAEKEREQNIVYFNMTARFRIVQITIILMLFLVVVTVVRLVESQNVESNAVMDDSPRSPSETAYYYTVKAQRRADWYAMHAGDRDWNDEPEPLGVTYLKNEPPVERVIVCYYNLPSATLREHGMENIQKPLMPEDIDPHLCTHINVAFASVVNKQICLYDEQQRNLMDVVKLKKINPKLKVLLSIGGASNDRGFPEMVANHTTRKIFIKSVQEYLRNFALDGIDLDWEFPAVHAPTLPRFPYDKRERQHFSQLLRELRTEFIREKRNYLLTVAAAAPQTIVDAAYDVDQLNLYADFVNIMTYDFHYFSTYTPFTGLNSPLLARPNEKFYMATLNINHTVHMYMSKGLDRNKIVVGIPTYAHTFTLVNYHNTEIGSPASGYGSLGSKGFVNTGDLCIFLQNQTNNVTMIFDRASMVPYMYVGDLWVSFEMPESITQKARFIKDCGLRGAMVYSLNADDYEGLCLNRIGDYKGIKFPLINKLKKTLNNTSIPKLFEMQIKVTT